MKTSMFCFVFLFFLSTKAFCQNYQIGAYLFKAPNWWNEVKVEIPLNFDTVSEIREYVKYYYGADVGTEKTWKQALKCWVLYYHKTQQFPAYIGHCFSEGKQHNEAIKVYTDLYFLANTQAEEEDWYKAFLGYLVGGEFEKINNKEKAMLWYSYSCKYNKSFDDATKYYGQRSCDEQLRLFNEK